MIWVEIPPERDGTALEDDEKEIDTAEEETAGDEYVDNVLLDSARCDPQKEQTHGDFEKGGTWGVEDFTEIPELFFVRRGKYASWY